LIVVRIDYTFTYEFAY